MGCEFCVRSLTHSHTQLYAMHHKGCVFSRSYPLLLTAGSGRHLVRMVLLEVTPSTNTTTPDLQISANQNSELSPQGQVGKFRRALVWRAEPQTSSNWSFMPQRVLRTLPVTRQYVQ